jgi:hypothetical protein
VPSTELMEALQECGAKLPESAKPSPSEVYNLFAGLLYWLETGSTEAPESAPEPTQQTAAEAEILRLKAELEAATAAANKPAIGASPVVPAPTAPVEPAQPVAATPAPSEPADTAPATPVAPASPQESAPESPSVPPVTEVPSEPVS